MSKTHDGRRWLDRADPRHTGATLAGDELWFAWAVDADSNHRPKPFVQMARINSKDMTLIEDVNLFDTDSAICYAGLATNANNEVGVSYMIGGAVFPSHVVGILSQDEANRRSLTVGVGERSPLPDPNGHFDWGDYLTARPVYPDRKLFAAAGYTMKGTVDSDNQDATPRFVMFGRAGAGAAGGGGGNGGTNGGGGGRGGTGGGGGGEGGGGGGGANTAGKKLPARRPPGSGKVKNRFGVQYRAFSAVAHP